MRIADYRLWIVYAIITAPFFLATAEEPITPSPSVESTLAATATPTPASPRSVRISFLPPPMDGTISLGIYNSDGKLVRVLHQQAPLDEFTVGADALITKWDGKDDDGQDLPAGKYHARGFVVGALQIENRPADPAGYATTNKIAVKLVENPLIKHDQPTLELSVGFDDTDTFLKTTDDLPLYVISEQPAITAIAFAKAGEKSLDVWQQSSAGTEHFRISKLDQMMAFDCGGFDLK